MAVSMKSRFQNFIHWLDENFSEWSDESLEFFLDQTDWVTPEVYNDKDEGIERNEWLRNTCFHIPNSLLDPEWRKNPSFCEAEFIIKYGRKGR